MEENEKVDLPLMKWIITYTWVHTGLSLSLPLPLDAARVRR